MKTNFLIVLIFAICKLTFAHQPKLVVGIVIDQMRWDYLYRYQNRYAEKGFFKTAIQQGFLCENTYIPYIPSVTACGHASIYTGSTPAIHGIVGNDWFSRERKKTVVSIVDSDEIKSPKNLYATTIGDQLKMSNVFKSRTFSVSVKDRASILPGGHACNAAFWWNVVNGNWETSSYYKDVPQWFKKISAKNTADSLYNIGWQPLYNIETYTNSSTDNQSFEQGILQHNETAFNYNLKPLINKDYTTILSTPHGITLTIDLAKKIIENEQLGNNKFNVPDMLTLSFSSTDHVGHHYGPYSVEEEDIFLRLDIDLGNFISYLDNKIGRENYLLFLTADHGVSPIPELLKEQLIPGGRYSELDFFKQLNIALKEKFGSDSLVAAVMNSQVYFNKETIKSKKLEAKKITTFAINYFNKMTNVLMAFECKKYATQPIPLEIKECFARGYHTKNSGDIQIIFQPYQLNTYIAGKGTNHSNWNSYDTHIPLIWLGNNIVKGKTYKKYKMTDIAPTVTALLKIEAPSSNIGEIITEVMNGN